LLEESLSITSTEAALRRSSTASTSARTVVTWIVTAQCVLLVVALWYFWVQVFYFGDVDGLAILSTHRADQPPVPAVPWQLGVHTFGDYIFPYAQALVPNPWTDYALAPHSNSYPPALMLVFKVLTFLPYVVGLAIFLALNVVSVAAPVVIAARGLPLSRALLVLCLLVFLSFPFLMVVDRGNAQGLLVFPLFLFVNAWRERRWRPAAVALSVAVAFKLYPALLALALLAERRFRDAAIAVGAAAAVTIVLFDLYPGGLAATTQSFIAALVPFSAPSAARITVSNYSALGMLANFFAAAFGPESPMVTWLLGHPSVFGIIYVVAVAAVLFSRDLPFVVRMACALSVLTLANSLSYGYTLCFVVIVIAELLRLSKTDGPEGELPRPLAVALAVAVTATLVLWPFPLRNTGVSVGTVIVPAAWIALTVTALLHAYGRTRRPAAQGA
jgi:alpha-1,2-mannosyltransferase